MTFSFFLLFPLKILKVFHSQLLSISIISSYTHSHVYQNLHSKKETIVMIRSCDLNHINTAYKTIQIISQSYNSTHHNNVTILKPCLKFLIDQHYNFIFKELEPYKNKDLNFLENQWLQHQRSIKLRARIFKKPMVL